MFTVFTTEKGKDAGKSKRRWSWPLKGERRTRALRLVETLSLGERRFVAVVEAEGQRLLIGATPQAVTLLGHLNSGPEPAGMMRQGAPPLGLMGIH